MTAIPIVLYDKLANRWVMSQFSVSTSPYLQCIAVSVNLGRHRHLASLFVPVHLLRRLSQDGGLARRLLRNLQHV